MMDAPAAKEWYLRKHEDGTFFGPLPFKQLSRWAWAAQIAPHDALSTDNETWIKAPMLPELGMDWLVEVTSERYYGPTTLGAIEEFVRLGEIDAETVIINSWDGTECKSEKFQRCKARISRVIPKELIHQTPFFLPPPRLVCRLMFTNPRTGANLAGRA